jgi:hypothetical protein
MMADPQSTSTSPSGDSKSCERCWLTNGSTVVILAKKWQYGGQSGFTPLTLFLISDEERAKAEEEFALLDSEQIARMFADGELHHIGQTGTATAPD